jgi:hypothetical protein
MAFSASGVVKCHLIVMSLNFNCHMTAGQWARLAWLGMARLRRRTYASVVFGDWGVGSDKGVSFKPNKEPRR